MLLSIVMPYYRNPRMLARHYSTWATEWPAELKSDVEVIIVDDASPEPAADVFRPEGLPALSIFRILEDRPWNQHAARNLGADRAAGEWLLMTDMDHVIPPQTLSAALQIGHEGAEVRAFTFGRRDAPSGEPWKADHVSTMAETKNDRGEPKPHVNSFMITRANYWRVGGYDEDYCGLYGTDSLFRRRLFSVCREVPLAYASLIRVDRNVIPDASTRDVARKEGREVGAKARIEREKAARGEAGVVKVLQSPWERVL